MGKVSIKGVAIGGVVDVVGSALLGFPIILYAMSKVDFLSMPDAQRSAAITAVVHRSVFLYGGELVAGLACSVLGGYVAGWLAKHDELLNGGLSSFLCVAIGILMMLLGKGSDPVLVQVLMLLASPVLAVLGGELMRRQRQRRLLAA